MLKNKPAETQKFTGLVMQVGGFLMIKTMRYFEAKFNSPIILWCKSDNKTKEMFLVVSWAVLKEAFIRSGLTKLPRTHNLSRTCSIWITSWVLLNYLNNINAKCEARILIVVMFDNTVKIKSYYLGEIWYGRAELVLFTEETSGNFGYFHGEFWHP